ncbi:hypothetical protein C0Q70_13916 [Pomacea canaliculata]|uniref:TNF receptor-associated factor 3 n=1 Tax=Pomacea canaliculata TaxID=400727 RepID=A0A2T7NYL0_POMCA|nr:hypothetical protein C0Q70_13916 [Pomacea canaliculata]
MDSLTSLTSSTSGHDSCLNIDGYGDPEPVDPDDLQRFQCGVHRGLLREPLQTQCGHRVCSQYESAGPFMCLEVWVAEGESRMCSVNEEDCLPVSRQTVCPDNSCVREMRRMKVHCVNKGSGCQLQCKYQDLKKHVQVCEHATVTCRWAPRGCPQHVLRKDLEEHARSCVWRPERCQLCGAEVSHCEMQNHEADVCPEKVTGCPYNCGHRTLKRKEVLDHRNVCPIRPTSCKFQAMGCTYVNTKELVDQHAKDAIAYHLELATSRLVEISQKRTVSETEHQDLLSRYTELEHNVHEAQAQQQNVQTTVHQIEQHGRDTRLEGQMATRRQVEQVERSVTEVSQRLAQLEERQRGDGSLQGEVQGTTGRYGSISNMAEVVSAQLSDHDRMIGVHDVRMAEMDLRFQLLETASYDGTLVWKIRDYARRKRDAVNSRTLSLYSQPFYTNRFGYKMCARVYLNGDGMGKKTHMSIFFVVMRGEYDALLTWPFNLKVTLTLLDQSPRRRHLTDQFVPDPTSSSFQRPSGEMNVASGCPLFVSQSLVENPDNGYVMDDTIFIRISVGQNTTTLSPTD